MLKTDNVSSTEKRSGRENMKEMESSLPNSLLNGRPRLHAGKCQNCGYALELYEMDVKKGMKVMRCERCGMMHFYKKDLIGKWRLYKAAKAELVAR